MSPYEDFSESEITAYNEGYRASRDNEDRQDNPYDPETPEYKAWFLGFYLELEETYINETLQE